MEEVEIPSYFLCPISLQIMRDPVTLLTGITYDRNSIEQWIFSCSNHNCPVTKQQLSNIDLIPNHTLRRLIQAWCALNNSSELGIERFPTPEPPVDKDELAHLIETAILPQSQLTSLRRIKNIVLESERNRSCFQAMPDAANLLGSIVVTENKDMSACIEALSILVTLNLSEASVIDMVASNPEIIKSLTSILQLSDLQARSNATTMLRLICGAVEPARLIGVDNELFQQIIKVIKNKISLQTTKAALHILAALCPWGRNRVKAVEADGVHTMIELLIDEADKRACELALVVLDKLASCAEGRAKLVEHAAGISVVSKKILRVSNLGSERAVRVLHSVTVRSVPTKAILQEMVQVGVVEKLCIVLQVECGVKAKDKAMEMLRMHSKVWKSSPCLSPQSKNSYPQFSS